MLFVADSWNGRIRAVHVATGDVFTLSGVARGFSDGPAREARFLFPLGVTASAETVYVADTGNNRVRAVMALRARSLGTA